MNIVERVERAAVGISDKLEHFVTHLGGDVSWGGEEQTSNDSSETPQSGAKTLLEQVKSFNPRGRVDDLFRTRFAEGAFAVGVLVTGSVALSKIEDSLGLNHHFITQLIFSLVLHPWR